MAAAARSSSMRSPTLTGMYVKTVPASVRCTPSTRMSRMVNGWIARTGSATARSQARKKRFKDSAGEESVEVVVEREEREPQQQGKTQSLADLHGLFGHGTALHDFGEIIHQVTPIQQGNREEIEHSEAHAHQREEAKPRDPAQLR